ncbi:hypothetical protein [Gordonia humi]|uniref:hypothetical protein n=1 Tax=Gordonia humi TaxID=686429 RepID=UPI001FE53C6A|nr:hypothetical protein [Gordonia humi]
MAIVSREYEVPCLLSVEFDGWRPADGDEVTLRAASSGDGWLTSGRDESAVAPPTPPEAPETGGTSSTVPTGNAAAADRPRTARTSGDPATDWWDYVDAAGDEIGRKPFPASVDELALPALFGQELTRDRLDQLISHMGRSFKPEMTRRSDFTSEIFPMMPYMSMSVVEDFHSYPVRVRAIDAALSAEEIGARLRHAGQISPLWIWMVGYHYLCGRELLISMGRLAPDEALDDVATVLDFWRRLALAHRGDGTLDYKDAGFTNRFLPAADVASLRSRIAPLDDDANRALRQLNAALSGYCFMYFTDSRVGICDNGPYPEEPGRATLVRDFLSLDSGQFSYPWAAECDPGVAGVTLVLSFPTEGFREFEINDWGTTFTEPENFLSTVTSASVIARYADGSSRVLTPSEWPDLAGRIGEEHLKLYQTFSDMGRDDRILSATRMYTWGLRPFARVAGVEDAIDWQISPATMALFPEPLGDDDQAAAIFGGALVGHDRPSAFSATR